MVRYKDENGQVVVVDNGTLVDENGNEISVENNIDDNTMSITVIAEQLKSAQEVINKIVNDNEKITKTLDDLKKEYTQQFFNNTNNADKPNNTDEKDEKKETKSLKDVADMF